jgi:hypothetical protein
MTLLELVDSFLYEDYSNMYSPYVPLADVLERATEEHMIELDEMLVIFDTDLDTVISRCLGDAYVRITDVDGLGRVVGPVIHNWGQHRLEIYGYLPQ